MSLGTPFIMHRVDESGLVAGPQAGAGCGGGGTDMGPALCLVPFVGGMGTCERSDVMGCI